MTEATLKNEGKISTANILAVTAGIPKTSDRTSAQHKKQNSNRSDSITRAAAGSQHITTSGKNENKEQSPKINESSKSLTSREELYFNHPNSKVGSHTESTTAEGNLSDDENKDIQSTDEDQAANYYRAGNQDSVRIRSGKYRNPKNTPMKNNSGEDANEMKNNGWGSDGANSKNVNSPQNTVGEEMEDMNKHDLDKKIEESDTENSNDLYSVRVMSVTGADLQNSMQDILFPLLQWMAGKEQKEKEDMQEGQQYQSSFIHAPVSTSDTRATENSTTSAFAANSTKLQHKYQQRNARQV